MGEGSSFPKGILQGYIDSALRRDNWDEVDRDTVRSYARDMLRELMNNPQEIINGMSRKNLLLQSKNEELTDFE